MKIEKYWKEKCSKYDKQNLEEMIEFINSGDCPWKIRGTLNIVAYQENHCSLFKELILMFDPSANEKDGSIGKFSSAILGESDIHNCFLTDRVDKPFEGDPMAGEFWVNRQNNGAEWFRKVFQMYVNFMKNPIFFKDIPTNFLEIYSRVAQFTEFSKTRKMKKEAEAGSIVVVDHPEWEVRQIISHTASFYYGVLTPWCISTSGGESRMDDYSCSGINPILFILNKKDKMNKFAFIPTAKKLYVPMRAQNNKNSTVSPVSFSKAIPKEVYASMKKYVSEWYAKPIVDRFSFGGRKIPWTYYFIFDLFQRYEATFEEAYQQYFKQENGDSKDRSPTDFLSVMMSRSKKTPKPKSRFLSDMRYMIHELIHEGNFGFGGNFRLNHNFPIADIVFSNPEILAELTTKIKEGKVSIFKYHQNGDMGSNFINWIVTKSSRQNMARNFEIAVDLFRLDGGDVNKDYVFDDFSMFQVTSFYECYSKGVLPSDVLKMVKKVISVGGDPFFRESEMNHNDNQLRPAEQDRRNPHYVSETIVVESEDLKDTFIGLLAQRLRFDILEALFQHYIELGDKATTKRIYDVITSVVIINTFRRQYTDSRETMNKVEFYIPVDLSEEEKKAMLSEAKCLKIGDLSGMVESMKARLV